MKPQDRWEHGHLSPPKLVNGELREWEGITSKSYARASASIWGYCSACVGMRNHLQYEALTNLYLRLKFIGNYQLDVIRELLISFPNLVEICNT
ncbi:hypothetical protein ACP4OV_028405 [Aristida adscensionis]